MVHRTYTNFEDIEYDLKRLKLEKQIAFEELKGIKGEFKDDLQPAQWVQTALSYIKRFGSFMLIKKLFNR